MPPWSPYPEPPPGNPLPERFADGSCTPEQMCRDCRRIGRSTRERLLVCSAILYGCTIEWAIPIA
jgi:hypothetical protein